MNIFDFIFLLAIIILFYRLEVIQEIVEKQAGKEPTEKISEFIPIRIQISPNWKKILIDHNLIDLKDWEKFNIKKWSMERHGHSILKDGLTFTIIKPDLIYFDDLSQFSSKVHYKIHVDEFSEFQKSKGIDFINIFVLSFFIKPGKLGFEIGINTPESVKNKKNIMLGEEDDFIGFAIIPYSEFGLFDSGSNQNNRLEEFNRFEWKRKKRFEMVVDQPFCIEHKYLSVFWQEI